MINLKLGVWKDLRVRLEVNLYLSGCSSVE